MDYSLAAVPMKEGGCAIGDSDPRESFLNFLPLILVDEPVVVGGKPVALAGYLAVHRDLRLDSNHERIAHDQGFVIGEVLADNGSDFCKRTDRLVFRYLGWSRLWRGGWCCLL